MKAKMVAFWRGVASILNLNPKFNYEIKPDTEALAGDWQAVGDDLWWVIGRAENENNNKQPRK